MLGHPDYEKLLTDFVGQPSLITTTAFANGFLGMTMMIYRSNFIKYGWKEAIEEGLKEKYPGGGRKLWAVMVSMYPNQFSGEYPSTDEARSSCSQELQTHQTGSRRGMGQGECTDLFAETRSETSRA